MGGPSEPPGLCGGGSRALGGLAHLSLCFAFSHTGVASIRGHSGLQPVPWASVQNTPCLCWREPEGMQIFSHPRNSAVSEQRLSADHGSGET